uniref:Uncharacterized protein n=1 Tax=Oryza barthii TaxID=65489 RepID=A0A0D3FD37_9ORYZ
MTVAYWNSLQNISQLSTGWWVGMTVSTTRYEAGKQNCSSLNWKLIESGWAARKIMVQQAAARLPLSNAVRISFLVWVQEDSCGRLKYFACLWQRPLIYPWMTMWALKI